MNITFINRMMGIKFGGGEKFDLNMARALKKRGHKIRFVVGREWNQLSLPMDENEFEVVYIKTPYLRDIHYKVKPTNIIKKVISVAALAFDRLLFQIATYQYLRNDNWTDIYQLCGQPQLGAKLSKKVVVWWPGPPSKKILKYLKQCNATFAHGNTMIKLNEMIPTALNIEPAVDLTLFQYRKEKISEKVKFVFLGRLIPVKRIDFLIKAFNEAYKINTNIQLNIIGEGTEKENLENYIDSDINFIGPKYGIDLNKELINSDVFCITSEYESFSIVVLEAMASSLPIIATNVGYLPNLVTNNGLLVELDNVEQLKNAILDLANDKDKRVKMGLEGRKRVENEFSWDKSAEQLEILYGELIK